MVSDEISPRQETKNLDEARKWLLRANQDYSAFRKFAHFDRKTKGVIGCSDPALAVYLLQQTIEKAVKAAAVASGQYSPRQIKDFSHNSVALLADIHLKVIPLIRQSNLEQIASNLGVKLEEGEQKLTDFKKNVEKRAPEQLKDFNQLYRYQFAHASAKQIDIILDMIINMRSILLKVVRTLWGSRSRLEIDTKDINIDTPQELVNSAIRVLSQKLKFQISEKLKESLVQFIQFVYRARLLNSESPPRGMITVHRSTDVYLGMWIMLALLYMAAFTFPHENSTRYPRSTNDKSGEESSDQFGFENYDSSVGIVNRLGRLGYVTGLILSGMNTQLESIAGFFELNPMLASK